MKGAKVYNFIVTGDAVLIVLVKYQRRLRSVSRVGVCCQKKGLAIAYRHEGVPDKTDLRLEFLPTEPSGGGDG